MTRKFIAVFIVIVLISLVFAGCVGAPDPVDVEKPRSVAEIEAEKEELANAPAVDLSGVKDAVADIMMSITDIKRNSKEEADISAFIVDWANANSLKVTVDEAGNVIVDKDAATGFETAEKVILQSHMDCLYFGTSIETQADMVKTMKQGDTLRAEGMCMGADSAAGMAMIMYIMQTDEWQCGPLRAVFTVDGANTLSGAKALDASLLDADKLINFNGIDASVIGYGHTGSSKFVFTRKPVFEDNTKDACYEIAVSDLKGGDSGIYADSGNANAIRALAECLDSIKIKGIDFGLSALKGGGRDQVIPSKASATVVLDSAAATDFEVACAEYKETFDSVFADTEMKASFTVTKSEDVPDKVLSQSDTSGIISLLTLSVNGVNTMSAQAEGVVESSGCLSNVSVEEDNVTVKKYVRGYSQGRFDQMENADATLAAMCGFDLNQDTSLPGWTNDSGSSFLTKAVAVYGGIIGEELKVGMLNTNMELGTFAEAKDSLDMIIVGADIADLHSTSEVCDLSRIENVLLFLYELLIEM